MCLYVNRMFKKNFAIHQVRKGLDVTNKGTLRTPFQCVDIPYHGWLIPTENTFPSSITKITEGAIHSFNNNFIDKFGSAELICEAYGVGLIAKGSMTENKKYGEQESCFLAMYIPIADYTATKNKHHIQRVLGFNNTFDSMSIFEYCKKPLPDVIQDVIYKAIFEKAKLWPTDESFSSDYNS